MLSSPKTTVRVGVDALLGEPERLQCLIDPARRRLGSDDQRLVIAQVAREAIASVTSQAVDLWGRERRVPDLSPANVVLLDRPEGVQATFRNEASRVSATHSAVEVIISAAQQLARCGHHHLWGTAALTAASGFAGLSHVEGAQADRDRDELLAANPHLARTIELITIDDHDGDELTFALRRTCCLLYKLPGSIKCGTCSLRDRESRIEILGEWWRQDRARVRSATPVARQ